MLGFALLLAAMAQGPGDGEIPPVDYPTLPKAGPSVAAFVPKGWTIETRADGDLNGDKKPDAALVLHMTDKRNLIPRYGDATETYDSNPRMLVVLFARPSGYNLAVADHRLIPRLDNESQEDPFDEIKVANGTLKVVMHLFMTAGGWEAGGTSYTFRWQDGAFKLIGFDRDEVHRGSGETTETSINFLTGHKEVKTGNIGSDKDQTRSIRMPKKPLIDLTAIGDGLMFDPDAR